MGQVFDGIDAALAQWIAAQPLWFVATAPLAANGHVNVSPRGVDSLSVLGPHRLGWLDLTGSGVETIAHLRENARICLMWCSFDRKARVVRVHGRGRVALPREPEYDEVAALHPPHPSARAVVVVDVERVSDSCGFGVPVMDLVEERDLLRPAAGKRGPEGLAAYRATKNALSLDGLPGMPDVAPPEAAHRP